MKTWLRWTLIITQVGGGFFGGVTTLQYLLSSENVPPLILLISLGFTTLYAYVTVAGVIFALDERRIKPLRVALWLQIPRISSPILTWWFSAGFCLNLTLIGEELGVETWLGSFWQLDLLGDLPWGIGANLFALLLLFLLGRQKYPQDSTEPTSSGQVETLRQLRPNNTNPPERSIRVQSSDEGDKSVAVRSGLYASVDAARREEIELLIRSASRHAETGSQQGTASTSEDQYPEG